MVSKKIPENGVRPQSSIVLMVLVNDMSITSTMSTSKLCSISGVLGIFLETNKLENLMSPRVTIDEISLHALLSFPKHFSSTNGAQG